jgi:hypothetical protein
MTNTTGKQCSIIIKDDYYNPALSYNLVSVSDLANNDYTSSFSRHGATLQGPEGMFDLIKTSNVYLLPVNTKDDQGLGAFSGLMEEERMHYRLYHTVNPQEMVILSKSGAKGIKPDMCETKFKYNICQRANIVNQDAPPAVTDSNSMTSHSTSSTYQRSRPYQTVSIVPSSYSGKLDSCGLLYRMDTVNPSSDTSSV